MLIESLTNNTSFCVLPFIHQEKQFEGKHNICCYQNQSQSDNVNDNSSQSFNSLKINDIRKKMIKGSRPSACSGCYVQEDQGLTSPRQVENKSWINNHRDILQKSIDKFLNNELLTPISYDVRYSNTCNLKCRMCNSASSSAINAEYKKINHRWPEKFWFVKNTREDHDFQINSDIVKVYLAGGEPLIENLNYLLFERLLEKNPNVALLINTSLNQISDKFLSLLNQFQNLTFVVSVDGMGKVNDYIRHGSNFDKVMSNVELVKHHSLMFSTTTNIYNILHLPKLIRFIAERFPFAAHGINIVNDVPEVFIENTPLEFRDQIILELEQAFDAAKPDSRPGIQNVINILKSNNFDEDRFEDFLKYTKILDTQRNESFSMIESKFSHYF